MKSTKVYFGLMVLLFLVLIIGGTYGFLIMNGEPNIMTAKVTSTQSNFPSNNNITSNNLSRQENSLGNSGSLEINNISKTYPLDDPNKDCIINPRYNNSIILRLDDVRAFSEPTPYVINAALKKNIPITLGVIPRNLENDKGMINYLKGLENDSRVEIALHGYWHNTSDAEMGEDGVLSARKKLIDLLGVVPESYIPPFNNISAFTYLAVANHFKVISSGEPVILQGKIVEIGQSVSTENFYLEQEVPIDTTISKCIFELNKTGICVVTVHPQEYTTKINGASALDIDKLANYSVMLDRLKGLNASFANFNDIVYCSN